jgi:Mg2+ and Co2+ transporter CorA
MKSQDIRTLVLSPGLIWGFDFVGGRAIEIEDSERLDSRPPPGGLRWLHFNLSDLRTERWLRSAGPLPPLVAEMFLSVEQGQNFVFQQDVLGLVLHDLELEFHETDPNVGAFRLALAPSLIITGRSHPLRSAEAVKRRLDAGVVVSDTESALELVFSAMTDVFRRINSELEASVQTVEDELLKDRPMTDARAFVTMRSLMVRMHRLYSGARALLGRLEEEPGVPAGYLAAADRFAARLSNLDAELLAEQSQLRLLRDELDLQATQQTNTNLYFLSVLTALLMPATLVTGIFGMNTGGLIWLSSRHGSLYATGLAIASSLIVYLILRLTGFIRR